MPNNNSKTAFAPAERSSPEELRRAIDHIRANASMVELLHSMPDLVLLLDANRQAVFANQAARTALGGGDESSLLGLRAGEILACKHSSENPAGCGTSPSCRYCGAASAILGAQHGHAVDEECRITIVQDGHEEALDLKVRASPVTIDGSHLTCFTAHDIADAKRRDFLERIFLHDLMNTAAALRGLSATKDHEGPPGRDGADARIESLSTHIIEEITSHRQLIAAESGELRTRRVALESDTVLREVFEAYQRSDLLAGRKLRIALGSASVDFESDPSLLRRVIGNMTKNAIEASGPGDVVTMGCRVEDGEVALWVHNPTAMPERVKLQVFNRSFSTKGEGRGLGTYSMKYLTEHYLEGSISFTSSEGEGTTFVARYPLVPKTGGLAHEEGPGTDHEAATRPPPSVVVADDEPVLRTLLSSLLRRAGASVLAEAHDGREAVAACQAHHPDVLLIDANMPVMSGTEALRQIRETVPTVTPYLLTGELDSTALQAALDAGAAASLSKATPLPRIVEWVLEQWMGTGSHSAGS